MRNPLTSLLRKKTRRSTTRKRRTTFSSTPLERVISKCLLKCINFFAGNCFLLLHVASRLFMIGNNQLPVNYLRRSRIALHVVGVLTRIESVIGDVHVDMDVCRAFSTPLCSFAALLHHIWCSAD